MWVGTAGVEPAFPSQAMQPEDAQRSVGPEKSGQRLEVGGGTAWPRRRGLRAPTETEEQVLTTDHSQAFKTLAPPGVGEERARWVKGCKLSALR